MGENTKIEWATHTFNLWWGCTEVSPECDNCYARTWAKRTGFDIWGQDVGRRTFGEKHQHELHKWDRAAQNSGRIDSVFWNSMSDICEDRRDLDPWRGVAWDLAGVTPFLLHLFLTKRPQNYRRFFPLTEKPLRNVWLGTTVGVRSSLWRIDALREAPAALRFLSIEPLLEDLGELDLRGIGWAICGSESGHGARPCNLDWVRSVRDQCIAACVPFFWKQHVENGRKISTPELDGVRWQQFPEVRSNA